MSKYILIFNGNNKELAQAEFKSLFKAYFNENIIINHIENLFFEIETEKKIKLCNELLKRITYTEEIVEVKGLYKNYDDLCSNILNDIYFKDFEDMKFCVRTKKSNKNTNVPYPESLLAKPIWNNLKNPCVSMDNFDIEYNFLFVKKNTDFFFGINIFKNSKTYLLRMPKARPVKMPYTLKSDMARACINLLELKNGLILDPFAGIGGILLEGADMGFKTLANDISYNDLKYLQLNFKHYYKNHYVGITLSDAKKQFIKNDSIDGIVTDIPYGKSCRVIGDLLYEDFLQSAKQYLKKGKKLVVIYANFLNFKEIALKYFTFVEEIDEYINASMTRHIIVLKNDK